MMSEVSYILLNTIIISIFVNNCLVNVEGSIVNTTLGQVRGVPATDGDYVSFLGIPYARVDPSNPFGEAVAYPRIDGVFEANDDSRFCPQFNDNTNSPAGTLDCLRMNIYIPSNTTETSRLPVLIFIHGGFFTTGNPMHVTYGPRQLVRHDIIVVSIGYRLGPYGFMCLDIPEAPGNRGLRDQSLAIRWIKENIQAFGGNSDDLTLFGHSAGGHSVDLHLHSNEERLFNKAILQSGSALAATLLYEPNRDAPIILASYLGFVSTNNREALTFLINLDTNDVIRASAQSGINFRPCVEHPFESVDSFITTSWVNASVPNALGVPIMVGVTEYERLTAHMDRDPSHFESLSNMFISYVNQTFDFDSERLRRMTKYMRQFYLGDDPINNSTVMPIINFESDFLYGVPVQRRLRQYIESGASNVFYYIFAYNGDRNAASVNDLSIHGASHGDDLHYLFDVQNTPPQLSHRDQIMMDIMTTMWTNFVKYSNPTPQLSSLVPLAWTPLTRDTYHYLRIDSKLSMERRPFHRRMAFWELFDRANYNYQRSFAPEYNVDLENGSNSSGTFTSASIINIVLCIAVIALLKP